MNKFCKKYFLLSSVIFSIFSYSCNNPVSPDPIYYRIANPPVITGIIRTGPDSPEPLGIIGTPNEKSTLSYSGSPSNNALPNKYIMSSPFPNPTDYSTEIMYTLPVKSKISLWVVRSRTAGEDFIDHSIYSNGFFKTPSEQFSLKLDGGTKDGGRYAFNWVTKDQSSNQLPDGFYRIYLVINNDLLWQDVWVYHTANQETY